MWDSRNSDTSSGSVMSVLFIIIIIWAIFGGGLFGGNARAYDDGCNRVSNCEVEKQGIIDSAKTQYLVETSTNRTIEANNNNTQRLYDQSSRQYEAGLQERIFDLKLDAQTRYILDGQEKNALNLEIATLKRDLVSQAETNAIKTELNEIKCKMLKEPRLYGQAYACSGIPVGVNGCNF